jgi:two-component system NtrC family sensor kinase
MVRFDGAVLDRQYAEMIAESIPHIVWTALPDGATTYFNRQGTDYTGCPRETNYEWNWVTLVHPEDAERAARAWQHATMTGTDYLLEYRIRRFDGVFRWHSFRGIPLRNALGEIDLWIGTATDIEDHKQLELALRRAEREATEAVTLLQSIEAATPVGFKLVDRDLRVVRINQTLADIEGRSVEECIGWTVAELVPDLWPQLENVYRRVLAGETVSNVDVSRPSAADPHRMRHWLASYYPVRIDGEIIGVGNVVVDITERKEAEEFRAVVMGNMAEGLFALDADGLVTYLNPAASLMLGWTEDELRGKPMHATVHSQRADGQRFPTEECSLLQVRTQGQSIRILDDAFTRKDGSIFPVAYSSAPLRSGPTVQGIVVVFRDITEEKKEQAAVRELDEAKDRLIATVSHELRTPLTSIDGYTELLEDGLGGELNAEQRKHVEAIRRNTDRLSRLVEDMLTLSGIEAGTLQSGHEELDLRDAVRQAWEELELNSASQRLATSLEVPPNPVVVRGDAAYLARAVSNLLNNAVKCTEDEGSIACALVTNGDMATLRVTDTGFGIPIQEQSSLFTRFFRSSTAQEREIQGSGLGLVIAAAVVHSSGGKISVASEHLGGAVFTMDLPLATEDARTLRAVE